MRGGLASNTFILGGVQYVDGKSINTNISSGGMQEIRFCGIASNVKINDSGILEIFSGGKVNGCTIYSGAKIRYSRGGTLLSIKAHKGAKLLTEEKNHWGLYYFQTYNFTVSIESGAMKKGTKKSEALNGTSKSDIFYGGKGNDKIQCNKGNDIIIYDTTNWGKDIIKKSNGNVTILFNGVKYSDILTEKSGKNLIITRKSDTKQNITIEGYNSKYYNIIYNDNMESFKKYLNAAKPTNAQITAARTEVWEKTGILKLSMWNN